MTRDMRVSDIPAMVALAVETQLFPAEAEPFLTETAQETLSGRRAGQWIVEEESDQVVAVAFFEPREATDRVWFVTMLAVAPALQGTGRGRGLLEFIEHTLQASAQRLLLIETSGTPAYEATRRFYERCGYGEVANVPSYFEDGDDLVLFCKDLRL